MNYYQHALTSREEEIIHLIAYEYSTKEIAQRLFVSYDTVKSHRSNIMKKLGAKNIAGVVRKAFEMEILSYS
jgi:DNA-binding CsgD family transcriptional regulator